MRKRPDPNVRPVYSTDHGAVIAPCDKRQAEEPSSGSEKPRDSGKVVKIRLEKKGRGGKSVTVASGLPGPADYLHDIVRELKTACGAGGTVKKSANSFEIEIQGDQRERVEDYLKVKGFSVKRAGG